jgi:glutathione synthase/RimK-type ligase-like ATP-grasp enzyme
MKKTVLILYTSHDAGPDVPFSDLKYQRCYEALYALGETLGLHLCRAPLDWYDAERDIFRDSWEFMDGKWRLSGPVKPDLVYDKTSGRSAEDETRARIIDRHRFMDDPAFTLFANNKYETSRALPQHFKPYRKLSNAEEFSDFLATSAGERLVIKPVVGSGGEGVHIVSKAEAETLTLTFPVIAQEFIDSSRGIPGITDTYHDLRMVFIGDELVYAYVRTPRDGSLLANIAQGGSMKIVPNAELPVSLQPIIDDTRALFARFPQKTYTIDVMFDENGRPWIIEYNTMPGMFFPPEEEATMRRVYTRLLQELNNFLAANKPIVAVIISTPRKDEGSVAFQKDLYREAYTEFSRVALEEGVALYRASTEWYNEETRSFRMAWHWDGNDWILVRDIAPDIIYDKAATTPVTAPIKQALSTRFPMINPVEFSTLAGSKLEVSRAFPEFAKPYYSVSSREELALVLAKLPGEMAVIKPDRGNSGEGVLVAEKSKLLEPSSFPVLVQEFIDSSRGIPGVMQGLHDLRLIYCDETLVYAYYRTPRTGSFLANVAQGGSQTMISESEIPENVWPTVQAVQNRYAKFAPKIYTIDLIFDASGRPWIVELNTMPGLYPDESERPHIGKLYRAIARALRSVTKKK